MAPRARIRAVADTTQPSLFESAPATLPCGSLQFDAEWRAVMNEAISSSGKTRESIAAEMEALLGNDPEFPVSKAIVDAWTASSKTAWRFPAIYLPAFIHATGADWLIDRLAAKCGRITLSHDEQRQLEIGRLTVRIKDEKSQLQRLIGKRASR